MRKLFFSFKFPIKIFENDIIQFAAWLFERANYHRARNARCVCGGQATDGVGVWLSSSVASFSHFRYTIVIQSLLTRSKDDYNFK